MIAKCDFIPLLVRARAAGGAGVHDGKGKLIPRNSADLAAVNLIGVGRDWAAIEELADRAAKRGLLILLILSGVHEVNIDHDLGRLVQNQDFGKWPLDTIWMGA